MAFYKNIKAQNICLEETSLRGNIDASFCSAAHRPAALSLPSVIDYCSFGNHSCDHECVSVLNGYHCRCNDGYRLLDNGKTCQGESQEAEVKQLADKRRVCRQEESLPQNTAAVQSSRLS